MARTRARLSAWYSEALARGCWRMEVANKVRTYDALSQKRELCAWNLELMISMLSCDSRRLP